MFGMMFWSIEFGVIHTMEHQIRKMVMITTTFSRHTKKLKNFHSKALVLKNR